MFNNINKNYSYFADIDEVKFGEIKKPLPRYSVQQQSTPNLTQQNIAHKDDFNLSIGDVAKILLIPQHTIRFWTTEFESFIKYRIGKGSRRYFSKESVEVFAKINKLLHKDGLKIKAIKERNLIKANTGVAQKPDDDFLKTKHANNKASKNVNYEGFTFVNTKANNDEDFAFSSGTSIKNNFKEFSEQKTNIIEFSDFSAHSTINKNKRAIEDLKNIRQMLRHILELIG